MSLEQNSTNIGKPETNIFKIAKDIESGTVDVGTLSKEILSQCIQLFRRKHYCWYMISDITGLSERTVRRYFSKQKKKNTLKIDPSFQRRLLGEVIHNWKFQRGRMLSLSYSEDLSHLERMKAMLIAHQVEKDLIELLLSLGYLGKEICFPVENQYSNKMKKIKHKKLSEEEKLEIAKIEAMSGMEREKLIKEIEKEKMEKELAILKKERGEENNPLFG